MHRVRLVLLSGFLSVASLSLCLGQTVMLDLPRPSQHAVVTQRIGITDITVNYHRPLANGRQIWGKLVPFGEVLRAGRMKIRPSRSAIRSPLKGNCLTREPMACT